MEFAEAWEIQRTCEYITRNDYSRVTLQFPDDMLEDAPLVADALQQDLVLRGCAAKVYVLADTSYNPQSVDEVAAAHVNADCVIHYGYATLNPVSRIPALCVLPKTQLDVQQCSSWVVQQLTEAQKQMTSSSSDSNAEQKTCALMCCDQSYLHLLPQLKEAMLLAYQGPLQLVFATSAPVELKPAGSTTGMSSNHASSATSRCENYKHPSLSAAPATCSSSIYNHTSSRCAQQGMVDSTAHQAMLSNQTARCAQESPAEGRSQHSSYLPTGGLLWGLPCGCSTSVHQSLLVWIGPFNSPALTHLQLTHSMHPWLLLDPATPAAQEGWAPGLDKLLKRRYYLVERARSASMVGLLVGTLGAAGYLQALSVLRDLAKQAGKKTYTLLMGKPNPAKLANFPEIEVFVMLADPQGLILDSKEYLSPIITPHEALLAFTNQDFSAAAYRLDFEELVSVWHQSQQAWPDRDSMTAHSSAVGLSWDVQTQADAHARGELHAGALTTSIGALVVAGTNTTAVGLGAGSRTGQQMQAHSAAQYLTRHRTYKGLETPALGDTILPAEKAVAGRSGRAAAYADEPAA